MVLEVHEMFTYVKLKNFMSFKDVIFDFRNGSKGVKSFISIYGENGSGKSNFVSSIDLLRKTIDSFQMLGKVEKVLEIAQEKEIPQDLIEILLNDTNILKYKDECRML